MKWAYEGKQVTYFFVLAVYNYKGNHWVRKRVGRVV